MKPWLILQPDDKEVLGEFTVNPETGLGDKEVQNANKLMAKTFSK